MPLLGHSLDSSIDELETLLETERAQNPHEPPVLALFTKFPSNPLSRSPDLERLRILSDKYDFLVIVDDTIGNFNNVETLPFADIVVTSMTKIFSRDSNIMGGRYAVAFFLSAEPPLIPTRMPIRSLILNPQALSGVEGEK